MDQVHIGSVVNYQGANGAVLPALLIHRFPPLDGAKEYGTPEIVDQLKVNVVIVDPDETALGPLGRFTRVQKSVPHRSVAASGAPCWFESE